MTIGLEPSGPAASTTDRAAAHLLGSWTIDPAHSSLAGTWRTLGRRRVTGRAGCRGRIHLEALPPVGVIRFQQPSGLPMLAMAGAADPNLMPWGRGVGAVGRQRWWTLHSRSLEVLPSGVWRVMATLTTPSTSQLVELRLAADPKASGHDRLVLVGRGALDRRAFTTGTWATGLNPTIQLELAVRARRAATVRGRVSGMSARWQDRVSAQVDPHIPGPLHRTSRKESG